MNWMLYGATGFTGKLTIAKAVERGHKPIIAGRSEAKLKPLAEQYGLRYRAFSLDSLETVTNELKAAEVELVLHCAGPFIHTSDVMIQACLAAGVHYLDITGEPSVFENAFTYHQQASDKGIVIMPGVGFDVVPSDCLLKYVAEKIDNPTDLKLVLYSRGAVMSQGTQKTGLEGLRAGGNVVRRNGELKSVPTASETLTVQFPDGEYTARQSAWGDVSTAFQTTSVPNITTFFVQPDSHWRRIKFLNRIAPLLKIGFVHRFFERQIEKLPAGPSEEIQATGKVYLYGRASNDKGESVEAWLEVVEAYRLTAATSVAIVERVLDGNYTGAMTPAAAFGADFILNIEDSKRMDALA